MLIMSYSSLGTQLRHVLTRDHTALPATDRFIHKWNEPYLPLLPIRRELPHFGWYSCRVLLRVRRLSCPGWLDEILKWFAHSKTVTHPSICCGGLELNQRASSHKCNALTTRLPSHNEQNGAVIIA